MFLRWFGVCGLLLLGATAARSQTANVSLDMQLRLLRAEDTRQWNADAAQLLTDANPAVRSRAALAAGRIGDARAVAPLVTLLEKDDNATVRAMAAFALGECEAVAVSAVDALALNAIQDTQQPPEVRARAVEALGKIAAALPTADTANRAKIGTTVLAVLSFEAERRSRSESEVILFGLTAALRARPEGAGPVLARFLRYSDAAIRADALNAMARLRVADNVPLIRELVAKDEDALVRANAARVLAAVNDQEGRSYVLDRAVNDLDSRTRVSAVRALATLGDAHAAEVLLARGEAMLKTLDTGQLRPPALNELLEIASSVGRLRAATNDARAVSWLKKLRETVDYTSPEVETALARVSPESYADGSLQPPETLRDSTQYSAAAAGYSELAASKTPLPDEKKRAALNWLKNALVCQPRPSSDFSAVSTNRRLPTTTRVSPNLPSCNELRALAIPDLLRAYAAFKPTDAAEVVRDYLKASDVIIRATAAELLGELPGSVGNTVALASALERAKKDRLNDAALATLDALAQQKSDAANVALKTALDVPDHLLRRRAAALLKTNGAGDFSDRIGAVQTQFTKKDYRQALELAARDVRAEVETAKGKFTIQFSAADAPLNVLSLVRLAQLGYFNGLTFHRIVPNFVAQGGDPRGDGNGGPGYSLRCEINQLPYERGAVGMALSGKDTGGSQWFVTHSRQPHLDGGYTVLGRVTSGLEVVDNLVRGDKIRRIKILQTVRKS